MIVYLAHESTTVEDRKAKDILTAGEDTEKFIFRLRITARSSFIIVCCAFANKIRYLVFGDSTTYNYILRETISLKCKKP